MIQRRIVWHIAREPWRAERMRLKPGHEEKRALTRCGRWVPLYLIGNPGDDPENDCKQCRRKENA